MKTLRILLVAAVFCSTVAAAPVVNQLKDRQHRAAHLIEMEAPKDGAVCSATAVAPSVLLTAHHCDVADATVRIDGSPLAHKIAARILDDRDSMLLVLEDADVFADYVPLAVAAPAAPQTGETIYFWGNPHGVRDIYRTGYVAGAWAPPDETIAPGVALVVASPLSVPGDSGSAIYTADGRMLGVLTYSLMSGRFTGFFLMHFTPAQLRQAGL